MSVYMLAVYQAKRVDEGDNAQRRVNLREQMPFNRRPYANVKVVKQKNRICVAKSIQPGSTYVFRACEDIASEGPDNRDYQEA